MYAVSSDNISQMWFSTHPGRCGSLGLGVERTQRCKSAVGSWVGRYCNN